MKSEREIKERVEEYMKLNYKIEITQSDEGGYFAEIPDLPGCMTTAENFNEINGMIEDAKENWLEERLQKGLPIPSPSKEEEFSGKTMVRMPRSLHRKLSEQAKNENVSLNQYIVHLLSTGSSGRNNIDFTQVLNGIETDKLLQSFVSNTSIINKKPSFLSFEPTHGFNFLTGLCAPFENYGDWGSIDPVDPGAYTVREKQKPQTTQLIASKNATRAI